MQTSYLIFFHSYTIYSISNYKYRFIEQNISIYINV